MIAINNAKVRQIESWFNGSRGNGTQLTSAGKSEEFTGAVRTGPGQIAIPFFRTFVFECTESAPCQAGISQVEIASCWTARFRTAA